MDDFIRYKTSSPAGDLLSLLPSIRQLYRLTGKMAIIYQALNVIGVGLSGQSQPFTNERGDSILMNEETFNLLTPLLLAQEYIAEFNVYKGEQVDYDIDKIRLETFTNQPLGSIHRWPFYVFPEMACDLSEQWLDVFNMASKRHEQQIFINFTSRYRNHWMNYYFLKEHQNRLRFIGLPDEREHFCKQWDLEIEQLPITDFFDLAVMMKTCKLFLGNASMCFQIAEGLKIPRLLETFQPMPNVIPMGKNGYDAYHQGAMEFYFKKLIQ